MSKALFAKVAFLVPLITAVASFVAGLAPRPDPHTKASYVLFFMRTYSWELVVACALLSIAVAATLIKNSVPGLLLPILRTIPPTHRTSLLGVSGRERVWVRRCLVALLSVGAVLTLTSLWPWARALERYIHEGRDQQHYRRAFLLAARAAEASGDLARAMDVLESFKRAFPDRVAPNEIDDDLARLAALKRKSAALTKAANEQSARLGFSREILRLRVEALAADPENPEAAEGFQRAIDAIGSFRDTLAKVLGDCRSNRTAISETRLGVAIVTLGLDGYFRRLIGGGSLESRVGRFCGLFGDVQASAVADYSSGVWRMDKLEEFQTRMTTSARALARRKYVESSYATAPVEARPVFEWWQYAMRTIDVGVNKLGQTAATVSNRLGTMGQRLHALPEPRNRFISPLTQEAWSSSAPDDDEPVPPARATERRERGRAQVVTKRGPPNPTTVASVKGAAEAAPEATLNGASGSVARVKGFPRLRVLLAEKGRSSLWCIEDGNPASGMIKVEVTKAGYTVYAAAACSTPEEARPVVWESRSKTYYQLRRALESALGSPQYWAAVDGDDSPRVSDLLCEALAVLDQEESPSTVLRDECGAAPILRLGIGRRDTFDMNQLDPSERELAPKDARTLER